MGKKSAIVGILMATIIASGATGYYIANEQQTAAEQAAAEQAAEQSASTAFKYRTSAAAEKAAAKWTAAGNDQEAAEWADRAAKWADREAERAEREQAAAEQAAERITSMASEHRTAAAAEQAAAKWTAAGNDQEAAKWADIAAKWAEREQAAAEQAAAEQAAAEQAARAAAGPTNIAAAEKAAQSVSKSISRVNTERTRANSNVQDARESVNSELLREYAPVMNIMQAERYASQASAAAGEITRIASTMDDISKAAGAAAYIGDRETAESCAGAARSYADAARSLANLAAREREIAHSYMMEYLSGIDGVINEAADHARKAGRHIDTAQKLTEQCTGPDT